MQDRHGTRPDFKATVADLRRNFRFLGETSAYFFLATVGEPVPPPEQCGRVQERASRP